jgi:hypothetical protein
MMKGHTEQPISAKRERKNIKHENNYSEISWNGYDDQKVPLYPQPLKMITKNILM